MIAVTLAVFLIIRIVAGLPRCYPWGAPLLHPHAQDCANIVEMIAEGDKASAPMHFSRHPKRGYQVPHGWRLGTCTAVIDLVEDKDATMRLSEIAFSAALISNLCIGHPGQPNFGGSALAGPQLAMKVIVAGMKMVEETDQTSRNSTLKLAGQQNSSVNSGGETS